MKWFSFPLQLLSSDITFLPSGPAASHTSSKNFGYWPPLALFLFFPAPDPLFRPLIQGFHLHLDLLLGFDRWPDIKKKATDWAKLNFSSQSRTWSPPLYWCNPPHFPLSFWGGDEKKKIIAFTSFLYSIWALNAVMSFLDDWFIPLLLESLHFSDIFSENTVGQKVQN